MIEKIDNKGGERSVFEGNTQIILVMAAYIILTTAVGILYAKRAAQSSEHYFLGGRSLGPWVTAMSAEASDMSGWLLMGLPGIAYWLGLADAFWTAVGLALGTYLNWLLVSRRLRSYSEVAGDAITIPDFFSARFKEDKKILMALSALFTLIFFTVYAASCMVTVGKLFNSLLGISYRTGVIAGAVFVVFYTYLGGFLAESVSDFIQSIVMLLALVAVMATALQAAGGWSNIVEGLGTIPGFLSLDKLADPHLVDGQQAVRNGLAQFNASQAYGLLRILSTVSWGLGYFGMPQVLLRFMGIRDKSELNRSRRIASSWCLISLIVAVAIGLLGRYLLPASDLVTEATAEKVFIHLATGLLPPILAGLAMAGILAATISSSDSYLLIAASAIAKNFYQGIIRPRAKDREVMLVSRLTLLTVALLAVLIAQDENSVIFEVVSFSWAGFGACFGPLMLFALFWKRMTRSGAIAGMVSGGCMVFIWRLAVRPLGGIFDIYELLPAFILSSACILLVSLLDKEPPAQVQAEFELAKQHMADLN